MWFFRPAWFALVVNSACHSVGEGVRSTRMVSPDCWWKLFMFFTVFCALGIVLIGGRMITVTFGGLPLPGASRLNTKRKSWLGAESYALMR